MKVDAQVTAVKSKKAGGDGVFLTKTHVKFHDSDDEYEEVPHVQPTKVTEEKETGWLLIQFFFSFFFSFFSN